MTMVSQMKKKRSLLHVHPSDQLIFKLTKIRESAERKRRDRPGSVASKRHNQTALNCRDDYVKLFWFGNPAWAESLEILLGSLLFLFERKYLFYQTHFQLCAWISSSFGFLSFGGLLIIDWSESVAFSLPRSPSQRLHHSLPVEIVLGAVSCSAPVLSCRGTFSFLPYRLGWWWWWSAMMMMNARRIPPPSSPFENEWILVDFLNGLKYARFFLSHLFESVNLFGHPERTAGMWFDPGSTCIGSYNAFPPSAPPLNYNNNYYNNSEKCHRKSTENPSNFFPSTELSWFYSFSLLDHVIVAGARKNRYISSRIAGNREEGSERRAFYFVARHITKDCDKFRHRTITRLPFRLTQGPVDVLDVDLSLYRLGEDTTTTTTTKGGEEKKGSNMGQLPPLAMSISPRSRVDWIGVELGVPMLFYSFLLLLLPLLLFLFVVVHTSLLTFPLYHIGFFAADATSLNPLPTDSHYYTGRVFFSFCFLVLLVLVRVCAMNTVAGLPSGRTCTHTHGLGTGQTGQTRERSCWKQEKSSS